MTGTGVDLASTGNLRNGGDPGLRDLRAKYMNTFSLRKEKWRKGALCLGEQG